MPLSGIDASVPATARIYDYWLGGYDNFAADRTAALAVTEMVPEAPVMAVENRKVPQRVVRFPVGEAGISQFLDIGTGQPTRAMCTRSPKPSILMREWSTLTTTRRWPLTLRR